MKKHFRIHWPVGLQLRWKEVFCAVCAVALFAACSKSSQSPQTGTATTPTSNETQSAAQTKSNAEPDLRPLNSALIDWRMQHQRVPANFEEFAASANIKIPPPPPGKKYIINGRGLISLVNR